MQLSTATRSKMLLILGSVCLIGATSARSLPPSPSASANVFSHAFDDAQFRKDQTSLGRMLARDMVYISGSGKLAGRDAFLAAFADPAERFEPFVIKNRRLLAFGTDVIAVSADATIRGTNGSGSFEDHFRFTDIFRRRRGMWQVIFVQVSRKVTD